MPLIARCISEVYGAFIFQFYKPSAREEAFLGFDQAWVRIANISAKQLFSEIKAAMAGTSGATWFWAFFLQFKRVERISRRTAKLPSGFSTPYYRAEISLKPNKTTRKSQHQTLRELSNIPNSEVYYACPMMFSRDDVYREPDPDTLRLVEVAASPTGYLANESHHIAFQSPQDPSPVWCSEPTKGRSRDLLGWVRERPFRDRFMDPASSAMTMDLVRRRHEEVVRATRGSRGWQYWHDDTPLEHGVGGDGNGDDSDSGGFGDWSPSGLPMSAVIVRATERGKQRDAA